jgi:hypothetical protein
MSIAYKIAIVEAAMTNSFALVLLVAASIAAASSHAEERSLHLMPAGAVVKDKFTLVGKTVPLPEGEFVFVASQVRDATHVRGEWVKQRVQLLTVYLVQLTDEQVKAEVLATTVLDPRFTYSKWEDEPCTRGDTLFRLDLTQNAGYQQNCLIVNHVTGIYTRQPPGIYGDAYAWLQQHGARLPIDVVIQASVTRIEVGERLSVIHRFNPAAYGCDVGRNPSRATSAWHPNAIANDAQRKHFVDGVVEWAKRLQVFVDQQFRSGARLSDIDRSGAGIPRCEPKPG